MTETMEEKIKVFALALLLAAGLMLTSFFAGWSLRGMRNAECGMRNDTIVVHRTDSVTLVEPRVDTLIRFVDRLYPVAVHDTIVRGDTLYVPLPYEHRYYAKPDTLEVWYSGVDPKIDSAVVYMHHTTEIVNRPYEVAKMPRLTLGLGAAAFYSENRVNPCLVGEMRYNAPKTTFSAFGGVNHEGKWGAGVGVTYRMNLIK